MFSLVNLVRFSLVKVMIFARKITIVYTCYNLAVLKTFVKLHELRKDKTKVFIYYRPGSLFQVTVSLT